MKGEITYLGITTEFTKSELEFYRDYRINGKPSTQVLFGGLDFTIPTNASGLRFLEELLKIDTKFYDDNQPDPTPNEMFKPVTVKIYDEQGYTSRNIELIDAHIKNYKEVFTAFQDHQENTSMSIDIKVVSAIQRINGKALNVFRWHYSDYVIEEYQSPVNNITKKEPKDKKLRKYQIDQTGQISLCEGRFEDVGNYDILMNQKGEEIRINNTTILPQFEKKQNFTNTTVSMARGTSVEKKDLAKIFLFTTANSNPEWRMIKTKGNEYLLGTKFDTGFSPSSLALGLTGDKEIKTSIHSHPDVYIAPGETLFQSEKKSMGYGVQKGVAWGDWGQTTTAVENNEMKYPFRNYVYVPQSGRLWRVGYNEPYYIRNIKNNYERFFFGTF
jgi:hypothetical protein